MNRLERLWKSSPEWSKPFLGFLVILALPILLPSLAFWGLGMIFYYGMEAVLED